MTASREGAPAGGRTNKPERMTWRLVFLVFAVYAIGTNALILAGVLPALADGLHAPEAVVGLGLTVFSLSYAVIGPFLPILLSRFGRRSIMTAALVVFIGGTLMSGLAQDVATFMVSRVIVAVAAAALPPQAAAIAVELAPPGQQGRALGLLSAGIMLSITTGVPIGALLGVWFGYTGAFVFLAGLGLIGLAGMAFIPATSRPAPSTLAAQFAPFRRPAVIVIGLCSLLFAWGQYSVTTFLAPILAASAGLSRFEVAGVLVVYGLTGVVAALVGGRLIDRYSGFAVSVIGLAVIAVTTPLFTFASTLVLVVILISVWSLAQNSVFPAQQTEIGRLHRANPATAFALNAALVQLGGAIGVAVSAGVLTLLSIEWVAPLAGIAPLFACVIMAVLARRVRGRVLPVSDADPSRENA